MVSITKDEKIEICKLLPNAHIVRTMKQDSRRHHYYMEESMAAMRALRIVRGEEESSND